MAIEHNQLNLKQGTKHYGRFYPLGYVVAFFSTAADREKAVDELSALNWPGEDLIRASSQELAELRQDIRDNRSLWDALVSKFANKDRVLNGAEKGDYDALLIYAPEQAQRDTVRGVLENLAVLANAYDSMSFSQIPLPNGPQPAQA